MVMVGVAIAGVLSPPGIGHPATAPMLSRCGAERDRTQAGVGLGGQPHWPAGSHAVRGGVGQAAGVQLPSGVLLIEHHDHRHAARGSASHPGTRTGKGQLMLEHARRAHRSANGSSASSRGRYAGGCPNPRAVPGSEHRQHRPTQKLLPPVTMAYTQKPAVTSTTLRMTQKTTRRITRSALTTMPPPARLGGPQPGATASVPSRHRARGYQHQPNLCGEAGPGHAPGGVRVRRSGCGAPDP